MNHWLNVTYCCITTCCMLRLREVKRLIGQRIESIGFDGAIIRNVVAERRIRS